MKPIVLWSVQYNTGDSMKPAINEMSFLLYTSLNKLNKWDICVNVDYNVVANECTT